MVKLIFIIVAIFLVSCGGEKNILNITFRETKSGKKVNLSDYTFDYMIIYVWTGTCVGHEKDLQNLNELNKKLGGNIKLVSLAVLMERDAVLETFRELNIKHSES